MKDKNEDIINLPRHFYSKNSKERKIRGKENRRRTQRERKTEKPIGIGKPKCRSRAE